MTDDTSDGFDVVPVNGPLTYDDSVHHGSLASKMADSSVLYPEGVEVQGSRVFMRLGNYEFEIVVPPTLQRAAGHLEAAAATARLLGEKLSEYRAK